MPAPKHCGSMTVPSDLSRASDVGRSFLQWLLALGVQRQIAMDVRAALHEAVVNAIQHGNRLRPDKLVRVDWRLEEDRVQVCVEDQGDGFRPEAVPDPTSDENLLNVTGRGLLVIHHLVDEVQYNRTGNKVTLIKYLPARRDA